MTAQLDDMEALVDVCTWPSEAYWRWFELHALREREFEHPLLELGCGDGRFTRLLGLTVDEGLDLSPRAIARARQLRGVYANVRCVDIRSIEVAEQGQYATIFANSVFEHVKGIEPVLQTCARLLADGGTLITTVPLLDMNDHLLVGSERYARFRQRQLEHHNLWSADRWVAELQAAGFGKVEIDRCLPAQAMTRWDALDIVGTLGHHRYRVATAARKSMSKLTPTAAKATLKRRIAQRLLALLPAPSMGGGCVATLVGTKA